MYIGNANIYELSLQIRGNFCGYSSKREKGRSDVSKSSGRRLPDVVKAIDIFPRPALNELRLRIRRNVCGSYSNRQKRCSDASQAAGVDSLMSSMAFEFFP
jgi:hypothetical protein